MNNKYKFIEIDVSRKKGLAKKFNITVDGENTARVIELSKGALVRELSLNEDLRGQM